MAFKEIFAVPNMIILISNVIFFIIVQTWFFTNYASKQINTVVEDKLNVLNEYLKYDTSVRQNIANYKKSDEYKNIQKKSIDNSNWRDEQNWKATKKYISPVLLFFVACLIIYISILVFPGIKTTPWKGPDWAVLSLVVFAYTTELFFYFGMVRQYIFYGDHAITHKLYENLENLNTFKSKEKIQKDLYNISNYMDNNKYVFDTLYKDINDVYTNKTKFADFFNKNDKNLEEIYKNGKTIYNNTQKIYEQEQLQAQQTLDDFYKQAQDGVYNQAQYGVYNQAQQAQDAAYNQAQQAHQAQDVAYNKSQ